MRQLKEGNPSAIEATALEYQTSIEFNNNEEEIEVITEPVRSSGRITLQALASNSSHQNGQHVYSSSHPHDDTSSVVSTPPPIRIKVPFEL